MEVLTFLISISWGLLLVFVTFPKKLSTHWEIVFAVSLGAGLSIGTTSLMFFVWVFILERSVDTYPLAELVIYALLIIAILYLRKSSNGAVSIIGGDTSEKNSYLAKLTQLGFLAIAFLAALNETFLVFERPHGGWDAWAFWNHRARVMASCFHNLADTLSISTNGDYPLLLPGFIARWWSSTNDQNLIIPTIVAVAFTCLSVGLVMGTIRILGTRTQAFLAGISLLGTWLFLRLCSYQYADIPLGFFFAATLALILIGERLEKTSYPLFALAGVVGGFAAWTKNEGSLILLSIIVARLLVAVLFCHWAELPRKLAFMAAGAIPALAVLYYFKTSFAASNQLTALDQLQHMTSRLLDPSRYYVISKAFLLELFTFHRWGYMAPFLILYLFVARINVTPENRTGVATGAFSITLVLAGYFLIYVITPYDLVWQMSTSLNRLFMQLWPSVILVYFLATSSPEEIFLNAK